VCGGYSLNRRRAGLLFRARAAQRPLLSRLETRYGVSVHVSGSLAGKGHDARNLQQASFNSHVKYVPPNQKKTAHISVSPCLIRYSSGYQNECVCVLSQESGGPEVRKSWNAASEWLVDVCRPPSPSQPSTVYREKQAPRADRLPWLAFLPTDPEEIYRSWKCARSRATRIREEE
jgi:hypothetical protein